MKNENFKPYLYQSLSGFFAIALGIIFFFCFHKADMFFSYINNILSIITPFIYGGVLAFLLTPICGYLEKKIFILLKNSLGEKKSSKVAFVTAILLSLILTVLAFVGFFYLVVPQIVESITSIATRLPDDFQRLYNWLENLVDENPNIGIYIGQLSDNYMNTINNWVKTDLFNSVQSAFTGVSSTLLGVFTVVKNLLLGAIISIYFLSGRKKFAAQSKKLLYSVFKQNTANAIIQETRFANKVFGGFIRGKIFDSIIIGIICFVVCSLLNMPYAMLISVIIGVTNIIPFFGPFIGAVPCVLLILTVNFTQSIYFIIFVIILQQFDGQILGPKILGQATGISGFWVLFAILFFGGLMGFVGMIIGVPVFAVIYSLSSRAINKGLRKKNLSEETDDYEKISHIDEDGLLKTSS